MILPLILALPLAGAAAIWAFRHRVSKQVVGLFGSGIVLAAFAATLVAFFQLRSGGHAEGLRYLFAQWEIGGNRYEMGLLLDSLSMWWMLVITGVGFLIHVYSIGYMADDADFGRFFAKLNYFIFAMSLLVLADNFMGLVIGWTNVGLASYLLIGFYIQRPAANAAQNKAYLVNLVGEVFMLAGIATSIVQFGTFNFKEAFNAAQADPAVAGAVAALVLIGAVAKSAQLPLHIWLPDAMQGPTPVSAMLHAATMVTAGVYQVARLYPIYQASPNAMEWVGWIGGLSALAGALVATRQNDIKKVLAYSTMSQIGYMFLGNGVGAHGAAAFHFMTHAFFKAALFLCAGIVIHELAGEQDIRKMGGLFSRGHKFSGWVFAAGCLALVGLFPFSGFFSKDEILGAALTTGHYTLFGIGVLAAGVTAFYNVRLFSLVFLGEPLEAAPGYKSGKRSRQQKLAKVEHGHGHHGSALSMKWPVALLGVLAVVGGALAVTVEPYLGHYFEQWRNPALHEPHHADLWAILLIQGVALLGMAGAWVLYGPNGRLRVQEQAARGEPAGILGKAFYFDEIYGFLFVRPAGEVARWVAETGDGQIIDGIVDGLGNLARKVGNSLTWLHSGLYRRYGLTLFAGLVVLVAYFMIFV